MIRTASAGRYHETLSVTDLVSDGDLSWLGETFTFRVTGRSMVPTLRPGDVLDLVPAVPVAVGDLVLFRHERALVCHRVIALASLDSVHTKGDGAGGWGEVVRRRDLAGKVSAIRRRGRRIDPRLPPSDSPVARGVIGLTEGLAGGARLGIETMALVLKVLLSSRALRTAARSLLRGAVSFSIGLPAPVKLLSAYQFVPVGRRPIAWDRVRPSLGDPLAWRDGIVLARVGGIPLGTFHSATGSVQVRPIVAGLGLEEELKAVAAEWSGRPEEAGP